MVLCPAQPGADQTVRQAQLGRHLRHRAATMNRSNRFAFERLRKAPAPYRILGHRHLQALQPIRGVHESGASPKPGTPPLPPAVVDRVVELTLGEPPHEATHWTGRMMAKAAGISLRSVQRIWKAHRLAPHRVRTFKLSKDPQFVPKLRDVVGLYLHRPRTRLSSRSTRRARYRRSTAPSRGCR